MISKQNPSKSYLRLHEEKERALKQKEETLNSVLQSLKNNPKFIKLLIYSLNSLENFVSPPNREIRINAKIIIKLEGVDTLRSIALINIKNEEIVYTTGDIIWKLISVYDVVDYELAKLFGEKNGQESVIEILLSKNKGKGSVPFIKILNGLCDVPLLMNKLLTENNLIDTIKLINDLYFDDVNVINMNFETMKKVSNLKSGRTELINKDVIPNILRNIKKCAENNNANGVLNGFNVLDNLSRNEYGKKSLKNNKAINVLSEVLDKFSGNELILKKGAKIYAKISTEEDMKKQIEILKKVNNDIKNNNTDMNVFDLLKEALIIVTNLMLVEDLGQLLFEEDTFKLLCELFENVLNKIDLNDKNVDYVLNYLIVMKYFMILFKRIFNNNMNNNLENNNIINNLNNSVKIVFDQVKNKIDNEKENNNIKNFFREYFVSYSDISLTNYNNALANNNDINNNKEFIEIIEYILENIIINGNNYFEKDERSNYGASVVLKISKDIYLKNNNNKIYELLMKCLDYMKNVINFSENYKTLGNVLEVILTLISNNNEDIKKIKDELLPIIIDFMNKKAKFRYPNLKNIEIIEVYLSDDNFVKNYLKNSKDKINISDAVNSVVVKAFYDTKNTKNNNNNLDDLDEDENEHEIMKEEYNEEVENQIKLKSAKILQKITTLQDFLKQLEIFKSVCDKFKPNDTINNNNNSNVLEGNLIYMISMMDIKEFFDKGAEDVLTYLKSLISKEIKFIEDYINNNNKDENYKDVINNSARRIKMEMGLLHQIENNAIKHYNNNQNNKYIDDIKSITKCNNEILERYSSDNNNLNQLILHLTNNLNFYYENDEKLKDKIKNQSVIEKYCSLILSLFRKNNDNVFIAGNIINFLSTVCNLNVSYCNVLVKGGVSRCLFQLMENISNNNNTNLIVNALELLKKIAFSNQENLIMLANQNILVKLFEIKTKFINEKKIGRLCDEISNEILMLPGQEKNAENIIKESIKNFHENVNNKEYNSENKNKMMVDLETINAFSSNKKQNEMLVENKEFITDLNKSIQLTLNDEQDISDVYEKLVMNQTSVMRKLKDNANEDNNVHKDITRNIKNLITKKSNYNDILLSNIKILSDYTKNENLYNKYLNKNIIDKKFIDNLLEISENYINNPEITKEINNILCNIALRDENLADYIVQKGGLMTVFENIKENVGLNDEESRQIKLNSLKMLNTLLNDDKNIEKFLKFKGDNLIESILKNEVKLNNKDITNKDDYFKTKSIINTNNNINNNDVINNEKENKEYYFIHCLKIINQLLNKDKNIIDNKQINDIITVCDNNFPNKYLFNEMSNIILNNNTHFDDKNLDENMLLLRYILSTDAYYYYLCNNNNNDNNENNNKITENIKKMSKKINPNILPNEEYNSNLKASIQNNNNNIDNNNINLKDSNLLLTYLSLLSDDPQFNENVLKNNNEEIVTFYKNLINLYKKDKNSLNDGIMISLLKLTKELLKNNNNKNIENDIKEILSIGNKMYKPDNYVFVNEFNDGVDNVFDIIGKTEDNNKIINNDDDLEENKYKYNKLYEDYLDNVYDNSDAFIEMYKKDNNTIINNNEKDNNNIPNKNEDVLKTKNKNFNTVLNKMNEFYMSDNINNKNNNEKNENIVENLLEIMDNDKNNKSNPETLKKMWKVIGNAIENDKEYLNDPENNETIYVLLDNLKNNINNNDNNMVYRKIPNTICKNINNDERINNIIMEINTNDYLNNSKNNNNKLKNKNIETFSILSSNPQNIKTILKNKELWNALKKDIENIDPNDEEYNIYMNIIKNIFKNNNNIDYLIENEPESLKMIINKIKNNSNNNNENEIEIINSLLQMYAPLKEKNIINDEDIDKISEKFKENENLNKIITEIKNNNNKNNNNDLELLKSIDLQLNNYLNEDENNDDNKIKLRGKKKILKNQKEDSNINRQLSFITSSLLYNKEIENSDKVSMIKNPEITNIIDTNINLIKKNYNELINDNNNNELNENRNNIITSSLANLKKLCISKDNHKYILESGLLNFIENLSNDLKNDNNKNIKDYLTDYNVQSKDILQCTSNSENCIPLIINSSVFPEITSEYINFYNSADLLADNPINQKLFLYDNIIFSNVCKSKKGFDLIFNEIGLDKIIDIGYNTNNIFLLESIILMLINYVNNNNLDKISIHILEDMLNIINKVLCLNTEDKTALLLSHTYNLISLIYVISRLVPYFYKIKLIEHIAFDFDNFGDDFRYLNSTLHVLGVICKNNPVNSYKCVKYKLINKLKDRVEKLNENYNKEIIYNLTKLYYSLVVNNMKNVEEFNNLGITENVIYYLDYFNDKPKEIKKTLSFKLRKGIEKVINIKRVATFGKKNLITSHQFKSKKENLTDNKNNLSNSVNSFSGLKDNKIDYKNGIMKNCIQTLEQITISHNANIYLSNNTEFNNVIHETLTNEKNDIFLICMTLHTLGNYLYTVAGKNISNLNLNELYILLEKLQKENYANSDILININFICGGIIKNINDTENIIKFFNLISESIKCQDWNENLILMGLKMMYIGIEKHKEIIESIFEDIFPNLFNILYLYKENFSIQLYCFKILTLFANCNKNIINTLINNGLLNYIKDAITNEKYSKTNQNKILMRNVLYNLLLILTTEGKKTIVEISESLLNIILNILYEEGYNENNVLLLKLLLVLLKEKESIEPFIQFNGIEIVKKLLNENINNTDVVLDLFTMFDDILKGGEENKKILIEKKCPEIINKVVLKAGIYEKNIEYEGKSLIYNMCMDDIDNNEIDINKLKSSNINYNKRIQITIPISPEDRKKVIDGIHIKTFENDTRVFQDKMKMYFNDDLSILYFHRPSSHLPPNQRYVIDTGEINKIISGNSNFITCNNIPRKENTFSLFTNDDKEVNVICTKKDEVEFWMKNIGIINDYYKNNKDIKMFKTTYFDNKDKDKERERLSVITEKSYFDEEDTTIIY